MFPSRGKLRCAVNVHLQHVQYVLSDNIQRLIYKYLKIIFQKNNPKVYAYIYLKVLCDKPTPVIFGAAPVTRMTLSRLC